MTYRQNRIEAGHRRNATQIGQGHPIANIVIRVQRILEQLQANVKVFHLLGVELLLKSANHRGLRCGRFGGICENRFRIMNDQTHDQQFQTAEEHSGVEMQTGVHLGAHERIVRI